MLLKYLAVPVTLAASVIASVTEKYGPNAGINFDTCAAQIYKVKEPVLSSCKKGSIEEVTGQFNQVKQPIQELSTKFHALIKVDQKVVVKYSDSFVTLLKNFQVVLRIVAQYPKIAGGCKSVFTQFDQNFDSICSDFKKGGVDLHKVIIQQTDLQLSSWATFGFKFQTKLGFSAEVEAEK